MTKVRFNSENGRLRTDVSGLPAGIYFLCARLANGELSTVVERPGSVLSEGGTLTIIPYLESVEFGR